MIADLNIYDIHEISVGPDPKNGLRYTVGRTYNAGDRKITVSEIVFNRNMFVERSIMHVEVWAVDEEGVEFVFKEFINVPMTFTPDINASTSKNTH